MFNGYGNGLMQILKNGEKIEEHYLEVDEILEYNNLYLFQINTVFNSKLLDYIKENYELVKTDSNLGYYYYKKK